jgi:hypothetical protein
MRGTRRDAERVPWAAYPLPPHDPALDRVAEVLDPILTPMSFAAGQLGSSRSEAQVIYCRGLIDSLDGSCVDLVVDLQKQAAWRITDVRYYGVESERMHLGVPVAPHLDAQLEQLARTIVGDLRED